MNANLRARLRMRLPQALLLLALGSGCAAESGLRRLDPMLTEADLRQGKVAVLGAVQYQEPDQVRPPMIAMLERTFREERRDVPLIPADSIRKTLGAERTRRLLLAYEYQGSLDDAALREISDSLRGMARYVLLARVEKDATRNTSRGSAPEDSFPSRPYYSVGVTEREAHVSVHLYDLNRKALVASGTYDGTSESERPMLTPMPQGTWQPTVQVGGAATPPEDREYPGAPELALAVEEPFRAFARSLPGGTPPASGTR